MICVVSLDFQTSTCHVLCFYFPVQSFQQRQSPKQFRCNFCSFLLMAAKHNVFQQSGLQLYIGCWTWHTAGFNGDNQIRFAQNFQPLMCHTHEYFKLIHYIVRVLFDCCFLYCLVVGNCSLCVFHFDIKCHVVQFWSTKISNYCFLVFFHMVCVVHLNNDASFLTQWEMDHR